MANDLKRSGDYDRNISAKHDFKIASQLTEKFSSQIKFTSQKENGLANGRKRLEDSYRNTGLNDKLKIAINSI